MFTVGECNFSFNVVHFSHEAKMIPKTIPFLYPVVNSFLAYLRVQ